jgi:cell division protein FtsI/penicillin-binding protein 2
MRAVLVTRTRILCGFFVLAAILLVTRLYFVQIVHGDGYARDAEAQYVEAGAETRDRGTVYFTTKDGALVAAAVMHSGWRIAIRPEDIGDEDAIFDALDGVISIDSERFSKSVAKKSDPYEEVAFQLSDEEAKAIRALDLPGVLLVGDQWRAYPAGSLAAQTIGFVGYRGDTKAGVYGLERQWEETLAIGRSGLYVNPFAEIFTNVSAALSSDPASHEGSIVTSIEPEVQKQLEAALEEVMRTYSPAKTGGIVMDPKTGEIFAMAVHPTFNPNTYSTVSDQSVYSNALVEGRYELGSIMKPLTMAIGIDSGAVTPATKYDDKGCITRSTKRICNFDLRARGVVPMQQVLSQSLNLGAAFVEERTGHDVFTSYLRAFHLDEPTGVDLPNEVSGDLSPLGDGRGPDINYAAAAFGQGIAVSPIEMTRALSALAAQGVMPSPHVAVGVRYESGVVRKLDVPEGVQVLKPETAHAVSAMLTEVYDEALLDGALRQEHYSIAAKTGTAQIAAPDGYYPDRYLHSFFGYFPAHEPRFIVFLFAVEPHGVQYASASLAHPFNDIAEFLIHYYEVPPDR